MYAPVIYIPPGVISRVEKEDQISLIIESVSWVSMNFPVGSVMLRVRIFGFSRALIPTYLIGTLVPTLGYLSLLYVTPARGLTSTTSTL